MANNIATNSGGGLYVASVMTVLNSIVAINVAGVTGRDVYNVGTVNASYTLSSYSDWSNAAEDKTNTIYNARLSLFVDADADDYHLNCYSQAINKGSSNDVLDFNGQTLETDKDGKKRIVGSVVDLGAYEFDGLLADIDLDGIVGPNDRMLLSMAWFSSSSSDRWDPRCDLDGDGFIGPGDYAILSQNYFRRL